MDIRHALALLVAMTPGLAGAGITVGVSLSVTGPAAAIGIPERSTLPLLPATIAGHKVSYLLLDDASDASTAAHNARRLVAEHKVDLIIGSTSAPASLAMIDVAAESETPMISLAASTRIVDPVDARRRWVFQDTPGEAQMVTAIVEHMTGHDVRKVAFIGFADAFGDAWWNAFGSLAEARKLQIVASERYERSGKSVAEPVARIVATRPDAVLIAGAGSAAILPEKSLRENGFAGPIYQTHHVANGDFLRAGGVDVEGTLLPASPVLVARELPETDPVRRIALDYVTRHERLHGSGSATSHGAHVWDAGILITNAVPKALGTGAAPGTREFRRALRDAIEATREVVGAQGIYNLSPRDHVGLDQRCRVMVKVEGGDWKLAP